MSFMRTIYGAMHATTILFIIENFVFVFFFLINHKRNTVQYDQFALAGRIHSSFTDCILCTLKMRNNFTVCTFVFNIIILFNGILSTCCMFIGCNMLNTIFTETTKLVAKSHRILGIW